MEWYKTCIISIFFQIAKKIFLGGVLFFAFVSGVFSLWEYGTGGKFLKMTDAIAPFFEEWKEIKHYSFLPYYQYEHAGWVDTGALFKSYDRFVAYVEKVTSNGYNAIVLDDINHIVNMKQLFWKESSIAEKNEVYMALLKKCIAYAKGKWLQVYITTDMQFFNREIEREIHPMVLTNPALRAFNRRVFEQVFEDFPSIDGVILRIGEGWGAYNEKDYKSKVIVKTVADVRFMLFDLLPIFEKHGKYLILRNWTIGIGEIGDFLWNKQTYDAVFRGISSPWLLVSVKYTPWDFFSFSSFNPIIGYGHIPQIVEIQIRREYEGGGDFVNFFWKEYQKIYEYITQFPQVVGVWNWHQAWGWGWGNHVLFNFWFHFWEEVNFRTIGYILSWWKDVHAFLDTYGTGIFSSHQKLILQDILLFSRTLIEHIWYIPDFREQNIIVWKLYIPPLLRVWWDRPTSSLAVWAFIVASIEQKGEVSPSYVSLLEQNHRAILDAFWKKIDAWKKESKNSIQEKNITLSLEYQKELFSILSHYQLSMLSFFVEWKPQDTGKLVSLIQAFENKYGNLSQFSFDFQEIKEYGERMNLLHFLPYVCILHIVTLIIGSILFQKRNTLLVWNKKRGNSMFFVACIVLYSFSLVYCMKTFLLYRVYGMIIFWIGILYLSTIWVVNGAMFLFHFFKNNSYQEKRCICYDDRMLLVWVWALEIPLFFLFFIPEPWIWKYIAQLFWTVSWLWILFLVVFVWGILFFVGSILFLFWKNSIMYRVYIGVVSIGYMGLMVYSFWSTFFLVAISPIFPSYFFEAGTHLFDYFSK